MSILLIKVSIGCLYSYNTWLHTAVRKLVAAYIWRRPLLQAHGYFCMLQYPIPAIYLIFKSGFFHWWRTPSDVWMVDAYTNIYIFFNIRSVWYAAYIWVFLINNNNVIWLYTYSHWYNIIIIHFNNILSLLISRHVIVVFPFTAARHSVAAGWGKVDNI